VIEVVCRSRDTCSVRRENTIRLARWLGSIRSVSEHHALEISIIGRVGPTERHATAAWCRCETSNIARWGRICRAFCREREV